VVYITSILTIKSISSLYIGLDRFWRSSLDEDC